MWNLYSDIISVGNCAKGLGLERLGWLWRQAFALGTRMTEWCQFWSWRWRPHPVGDARGSGTGKKLVYLDICFEAGRNWFVWRVCTQNPSFHAWGWCRMQLAVHVRKILFQHAKNLQNYTGIDPRWRVYRFIMVYHPWHGMMSFVAWHDAISGHDMMSSLDQHQHGSSTRKTKRRYRATPLRSKSPLKVAAMWAKTSIHGQHLHLHQHQHGSSKTKASIQSQRLHLRQHQHGSSTCKAKTPTHSHTIEKLEPL